MNLTLAKLFLEQVAPKKKQRLTLEATYFGNQQLKEVPKNGILEPGDLAIMDAAANEIEAQIDQAVPLEESMLGEKMSKENKGMSYEGEVIAALRAAKAAGSIQKGAGACATCADADMMIYDKVFNLEVKLDREAQMGGGSLRYKKGVDITFTQDLEETTKNLLLKTVEKNAGRIDNLISFLNDQEPREINTKKKGFPGTWTEQAWIDAGKQGLLINDGKAARVGVDWIIKHYAKKGVYYIQIGGAGLFYMGGNPANLPIPKLQGDIFVELGTRPGGTKSLASGIRVKGAGIRCQGRLITNNSSPYTLDDPVSIQKMLSAVEKKKPNTTSPVTTKADRRKKPSNRRRVSVRKV